MKEQSIVRFKDKECSYQAEVKAFEMNGKSVFDVYYSIAPDLHPVKRAQVYFGSGNGPVVYWRQRITTKDDELLPQEFVEAIGFVIE